MPQATFDNTTYPPVDRTRRRFLFSAAGAAAGGTTLAMALNNSCAGSAAQAGPATSSEAVAALIEEHRRATDAWACEQEAVLSREEGDRLRLDACDAERAAMDALIGAVPASLPATVEWISYLCSLIEADAWQLSEERFHGFLPNLHKALRGVVS